MLYVMILSLPIVILLGVGAIASTFIEPEYLENALTPKKYILKKIVKQDINNTKKIDIQEYMQENYPSKNTPEVLEYFQNNYSEFMLKELSKTKKHEEKQEIKESQEQERLNVNTPHYQNFDKIREANLSALETIKEL